MNSKKVYSTKNDNNVFKKLRIKDNKSQKDISEIFNVTQSAISKWETGKALPDPNLLTKIAEYYKVTVEYLLGKTDLPVNLSQLHFNDNVELINLNNYKFKEIPVLGSIAAGTPISSIEDHNYDSCIVVDASSFGNGIYFGLKIKGDSMAPRILEDDFAVIKVCDWVSSGDIAAVRVNGDETTLKIIKFEQNGIWLIGINPTFKPIYYTAQECEKLPVTIIGKLVQVIQQY